MKEAWAIQIILHVEKDETRTLDFYALEAGKALISYFNVIQDKRLDCFYGEEVKKIKQWESDHIRKIVRRARGKDWEEEIRPHIYAYMRDDVIAIAHPGPMDEVPPEIHKLQIEGMHVPHDPVTEDEGNKGFVIAVNPEYGLEGHQGKLVAQVCHAFHVAHLTKLKGFHKDELAAAKSATIFWPDKMDWKIFSMAADIKITDAGFTVVAPGSTTVAAAWRD